MSGFQVDSEVELTAEVDLVSLVQKEIQAGAKPNQAIKTVAKAYQVNRQELYQQFHDL